MYNIHITYINYSINIIQRAIKNMADINTIQRTNLKNKRFNFSDNEINHMQALISNGTITSAGKQHASIIRETANNLNLRL